MPASYGAIAAEAGDPPAEILFISDVAAELDAARAAGMRTVLSLRPGNHPAAAARLIGSIRSFDEIAARLKRAASLYSL